MGKLRRLVGKFKATDAFEWVFQGNNLLIVPDNNIQTI